MNCLVRIAVCGLFIGGCTPTPDKYKDAPRDQSIFVASERVPAQSSKMQAVATTEIGNSAQYTDPYTGQTVKLQVQSEYFSANGRFCRRYTEMINTQNRNGVSCQDARQGWVELRLADYLR